MPDNLEIVAVDIPDPLLECLTIICKYYDKSISKEALCAGLPLVNHRLTPSLFVRATERINLNARIVRRPLVKIPNLVLPTVLILKDNQACILQKINADQTVEIILPETGTNPIIKTLAEIETIYAGYAIFVQPLKASEKEATDANFTTGKFWFWGTLWHYRNNFAQVLLAAFFINLFTLASPLFVMNVYDRVVPNATYVTLWVLVIGILIIFAFDYLLRTLRAYIVDVNGKKADIVIASQIFSRIIGMELVNKPKSMGAFLNSIREFETVRDFFTSATLVTLIDFPFVILFLIAIWYLGSYLVLIPLIIIPLLIFVAWLSEFPVRKHIADVMQSSGQKNAVLVETLTGLEAIKSLTAEGIMQRKWEKHVANASHANLKAKFITNSMNNFSYLAQQLVTIALIVVGVYLIEAQSMTLGALIACSILAGRTLAPVGQIVAMIARYQQAKVALEGLNQLMAMPIERESDKNYLHITNISGDIEFQNVSFKYPHEQNQALDNISFTIKAKEKIAILGRIGSGKTTAQKLLLNLFKPAAGKILIDNLDLQQIDPADLRQKIGYVPQETILFSGTVRENIMMAYPAATDDMIISAAKLAGVDTFVNLHPLGYAMPVGDRGEGLSGGQRQAIAIARALLTKPDILLLDEPTSSMDNHSELEILNRIQAFSKDKTLILTTHKTSLLQLVDRVIILEHGKIIADGPKDKILQKQTPEKGRWS